MKNEKRPTAGQRGRAREMDGATYISSDTDFTTELGDLQGEVMEKFTPKRGDADKLAGVYAALYGRTAAPSFQRRAFSVGECGTFLEYRVSAQDRKLHAANFCRDRLCPLCTWRRSLKIFAQISRVMDVLEKDYCFLFLTLTVRNRPGGDLPETIDMLYDGWRKMYHESAVFKRRVAGTFRALECTRNERTGDYHPHLHVVLAVKPDYFAGRNYMPKAAWAKLWRECCGLDYSPVVDVRKIKPGARGLAGAVAEVSKYAVKSQDFLGGTLEENIASVSDYLLALAGRRLCGFTGVFGKVRRQLALDDLESGNFVDVDGSGGLRADIAYMVVRYRWRAGVYVREIVEPGK